MGFVLDIRTAVDGKRGERITEKSVALQKKRKETVAPIVKKMVHIYDESTLSPEALYKYYVAVKKFGGDIVTCEKKKILIYDSMRNVTTKAPKKALVISLRLGLHESLQAGYSNQYKHYTDTFPIEVVNWCLQQTNNHDCGVYVIKFIDNIENLNLQFQLKLGNLWIAHNLFFHPSPLPLCGCGWRVLKIIKTSLKNLNRPYYSCPKISVSDNLNVLLINE
ncbi:hypothetical protein M9H77_26149 [Catharanthus roseus]|uniref:Uncharacterized protein n=1 Tax=Catharanthus roseus TaxID=4058 RepID=A0ACC0A9B0_CATRO|nr:hypothetical protein M9H77_26149 [Catharanthus roseus]